VLFASDERTLRRAEVGRGTQLRTQANGTKARIDVLSSTAGRAWPWPLVRAAGSQSGTRLWKCWRLLPTCGAVWVVTACALPSAAVPAAGTGLAALSSGMGLASRRRLW